MDNQLTVGNVKAIGIVLVMLALVAVSAVPFLLMHQDQKPPVTVTVDGEKTICTQDQQYDQQSVAEMMQMISDLSNRIDATDAKIEQSIRKQKVTYRQWSEQYR